MSLFSPELFFTLSLLFFFLYLQFLLTTKKRTINNKGFKMYPLVGALPAFLKNRHRFLDWTTTILQNCPTNTAVFTRPGGVKAVITANPENVEHVLKTNFENYPKGERFITLLEDFLGEGIFNSDGELWKLQRKTSSYEFNTKSLRNFIMESVTDEVQTRLIPILSKASQTNNNSLDLQELLERFGFDSVCKIAFNVDPRCLDGDGTAGAEFMRAFVDASIVSSGRFLYTIPFLWKIKKFLNIGTERKLRESISVAHEFADQIIRSKMEENQTKGDDLLSRFIGKENTSLKFLRDIVISFILAGRDSTSSALSWFFWIVSTRVDVKEKILHEIKMIRLRSGLELEKSHETTAFGYEELKEMQYLHAALSETMRLYPPVPLNTKTCLNDDVLVDGTRVGKGWYVCFHTYAMGRMESVWGKDCCEFKPERWLENGVCRSENPFRFPVFHGGPRICLGKEMAYIQMKCIAASVLERFEIEALDKDASPERVFSFTLRMKKGLPVRVRERDVLRCASGFSG